MPSRPRLPSALRARRDYLQFRFQRDWPYVLSVLGLSFGAASLIAEAFPSAAPKIVVSVLTCVGFATCDVGFRRETAEQRALAAPIVVTATSGALPDITPSTRYDGAHVVEHPRLDQAVVHEGADRRLDASQAAAEWLVEPFRLGDDLRATAVQTIGERLKHREVVFNGGVVRLATDVIPANLDGTVSLQRATYFDHVCSNRLTRTRIRRAGTSSLADESFFARYVADRRGALRDLADQSRLANIIGVSTLAFTSDEQLVLVNQSGRSAASKNLLAPSGSGSLEARDRAMVEGPGSLRTLVVAGMERELAEECNLPRGSRLQTRLTGFARWMEYGGKPEFFGVTRLHGLDSRAVLDLGVRRDERIFTHEITVAEVDLTALRTAHPDGSLDRLPGVPQRVLDHASMPLLLALRALGRRLSDDPEFVPAASPEP